MAGYLDQGLAHWPMPERSLSALADPAHRYQRRVVAAYLGASTLLFGVGVALLIAPGVQNTTTETVGMWLIVVSALMRKGIVPFHAWVPEVFDHGRLGPAILFDAPQAGAYMTVVLIVPRASPDMLRMIAVLALGTAVYGAALALVQSSARRACRFDHVPRRLRADAATGDQLSRHGPRVHRLSRHARLHRSGAAGGWRDRLAVLRMYFSLFCGRSDALAGSGVQFGLTGAKPGHSWRSSSRSSASASRLDRWPIPALPPVPRSLSNAPRAPEHAR